jgi:hypothetical protein
MIAQAIPYMIEVRPAPRATGVRPPLHIVVIRDKPCPKAFASPTLIRVNDPPKLTEVSDLLYRVRVAEKLASGAIFESQAAEQALILEQNRLRSVARHSPETIAVGSFARTRHEATFAGERSRISRRRRVSVRLRRVSLRHVPKRSRHGHALIR